MITHTLKFISLLLFFCGSVHAGERGGDSSGGGDGSGIRFDEIRSDLYKWVSQNGGQDLKLGSLSSEDYKNKMLSVLKTHKVVVSFTSNPVLLNGTPKTCKWTNLPAPLRSTIECNIAEFGKLSGSKQYELVHHEYAGIAGVENASGASSIYPISSQITEDLHTEIILKLAVKKKNQFEICTGFFEDINVDTLRSVLQSNESLTGAVKRCITVYRNDKKELVLTKITDIPIAALLNRFAKYFADAVIEANGSAVVSPRQLTKFCKDLGYRKAFIRLSSYRVDPVISDSEFETILGNFSHQENMWYSSGDHSLDLIQEAKCVY